MDTGNLMDALNGGGDSSGDSSSFATTPPLAPPGGASPNVPAPQNTDLGAAPDIGGQPSAGQPIATNTPGGPAKPGGQASVWKDIVMGALTGLAGSAGATHFGGGLAAGAAGVVQAKQREIENQQRGQQIQMESARAADSHIIALDEHNRAERLNDEAKLDYAQKSANYQAFLQDNFGIEPNLSFNDHTNEAMGAMSTLAAQNGGTVPPVSAVHQPAPDGTHGKVAAYSPSQQQMQQNSNGFREIINTQRAVQGQPPIDNATFNSLGFKGQRDAAQGAIEFLKPTPSFSMDKNKTDFLPVVLAQRQQQLAQYQGHKDENGNPDANPNVVRQLQNSVSFLQNSWDSVNTQENKAASDAINATAPAKANAAALDEIAKNTGAAGDAQVNIAARKKTVEQAIQNGDPTSAGQLLASRTTTISELKSRGMTPQYITQAIQAAQKIDSNYNAVQEDNNAKIAGSEANNQFFGNVNSLVAAGGTLDQLKQAGDKISQSDYQILNKTKNWKDLQTGKGGISAYAAKAVGVADDYSKVMGGSVGSDASRNLVLHIISPNLAPDQRAEAIEAVRDSVNSQKESRIGNNSFLRKMYSTMPTTSQPKGADFFKQHGGQVSQ